ncbi:MAG: phosphatidate cytidylyltransferase [Flavobacteriaceae bacterium TMED238]|nr:MAG: phosphatidate cytidylyltransferase [Flavobacteriaceae bacterium TMED238]
MILKDLKKRIYTSISLLVLIYLIFNFNLILVFSLIVFGVLSLLEFIKIINKIFKNNLKSIIINSFFLIYVSLFCFLFLYFSNFLQLKIILFTLLIGCVFSDIGGVIFGKIFKGPKLTKISPNKTIAGAIGSIIFTIIFLSGIFYFLTKNFDNKILLIATITSISCQLGDLFFSFLKRKAKIKNTGNFLPGHGGILDRLDGIFLGVPSGFIFLTLLY